MKASRFRWLVPAAFRPVVARCYVGAVNRLLDSADRVRASLGIDPLTPPRNYVFVGGGGYKQVGREFRNHFIELGGLKPEHHVLDVGCGIGRMAVPLTSYLDSQAQYRGFDIVKKGVEWCQQTITPRFPNFQFRHADVYSKHYNPDAACRSSEYRFPYPDGSFDFVFLTSVFTHMMHAGVENYMAEIARVTRPGGRLFATWFLLNDEANRLLDMEGSPAQFHYAVEGFAKTECRTTHADDPEAAVAFHESVARDLIGRHGFRIVKPIHFGVWCGREHGLSYQDIVVATRINQDSQ